MNRVEFMVKKCHAATDLEGNLVTVDTGTEKVIVLKNGTDILWRDPSPVSGTIVEFQLYGDTVIYSLLDNTTISDEDIMFPLTSVFLLEKKLDLLRF